MDLLLLGHFEHHICDRFPNVNKPIQQRLARAMLLQQKRVLYRRHRQGNEASNKHKEATKQVPVTLPAAQPTVPKLLQRNLQQNNHPIAATIYEPSQTKSATTLAPDKFKTAITSPSIISASKTVALGNHEALKFPPAPGFAAKKKYKQLKLQRLAEHEALLTKLNNKSNSQENISSADAKLEETLKLDLQAIGEITCPYCLYALPAEEVFDEQKWQ